MKKVTGSLVIVLAAAGFSAAAVNVDVSTPNASVHVGSPQQPSHVTVVERERVAIKEQGHKDKKDNGKHKGQKKQKKHKNDRHEGSDKHRK